VKPAEQVVVHAAPLAAGRVHAKAAALLTAGGWAEQPGEGNMQQGGIARVGGGGTQPGQRGPCGSPAAGRGLTGAWAMQMHTHADHATRAHPLPPHQAFNRLPAGRVQAPVTFQAPLVHVALGVPVKPAEQVVVHAAPFAAGRVHAKAVALPTAGGWAEQPGEGECVGGGCQTVKQRTQLAGLPANTREGET
jgi:hypothetical protein